MCCRRCGSIRLIKLGKRLEKDNDVYRCGECGYIFSPSDQASYPEHRIGSLMPKTGHQASG